MEGGGRGSPRGRKGLQWRVAGRVAAKEELAVAAADRREGRNGHCESAAAASAGAAVLCLSECGVGAQGLRTSAGSDIGFADTNVITGIPHERLGPPLRLVPLGESTRITL